MSTTELPAAKAPPRLLALIALAVLALAAAGYAWRGEPQLALNPPEKAPPPMDEAQIVQMVENLAQRLKQQPDDPKGWAMLGRSYLVMGRADEALAAYREAMKRTPDDPALLTDAAGAMAMAAGQRMTPEAMALVERALKLDPGNLKALSLAGSAAFDREDWAGAVKHWERIVALAPKDADFIPQVQAGIDEARERGKLGGKAAAAPAQPAAAAGASVQGRVSLAPALRAQAAPEDTVFVFARAAEGPRVPLAVVRRQVKDLPFDFTLDDSTAMSPQMRISGFPQVVVGARISKRNDATAQPGDLTATAAPVALGTRGLALEISEVVR
jgi:cytochrome c-type biogenesis protein CcmH